MIKRIRNRGCVPYVGAEGVFTKPFPAIRVTGKTGHKWYSGLTPFERCFAHQTLASTRRFACFKPFSGLVPQDNMDFKLQSTYDHSHDSFPYPGDPCLQAETLGINTWRRLRNSRDLKPEREDKGAELCLAGAGEGERYNNSHPVLIGGITEREHPSHVKLMNSSHHSPQTNAGYCRQESYGTFFQY